MNNQATLNEIFSIDEKLKDTHISKLETADCVVQIKKHIENVIKGIKWRVVIREVAVKISDLLSIPIPDILKNAWSKYEYILRYLEENKVSPDESVLIPMAEHTVKSEHKPSIEILVNDIQIGKIDFEIIIELKIKGILLKVQNRKLMEIHSSECKGSGFIKCENQVLLKKDFVSISLPGIINLSQGISIAE